MFMRRECSSAPSTPSLKCGRRAEAPSSTCRPYTGWWAVPTSTAYHAAKGASRLFTKSAAVQYAGENIRVNSVHPGYCWTPLTDPGYSHEEGRRDWSLERIPLGRLGNADDIAHGIVYLASDESSFVTGAELVIDGGTTAQ